MMVHCKYIFRYIIRCARHLEIEAVILLSTVNIRSPYRTYGGQY